MKIIICVLAFGLVVAGIAGGQELPKISAERLEHFIHAISEITFPVRLRDFTKQVGGEKEIIISAQTSDEFYMRISARNAAGGYYEIRLRYEKSPSTNILDTMCDEPQIIYVSESPLHIFVLEDSLKKSRTSHPQRNALDVP